jgi:hypothetical protein
VLVKEKTTATVSRKSEQENLPKMVDLQGVVSRSLENYENSTFIESAVTILHNKIIIGSEEQCTILVCIS